MQFKYIQTIIFSLVLLAAMSTQYSLAADYNPRLDFQKTLSSGGITSESITDSPKQLIDINAGIGRILGYLIGFVGSVILALIIYAGGMWATAAGNEEKVKKAKNIMLSAVIGLIIVLTAAFIVGFVVDTLTGTKPVSSTEDQKKTDAVKQTGSPKAEPPKKSP